MSTQVIVLNGGSSAGKSGILRCLQAILPDPWVAAAVDAFVDALPASMRDSDAGITFDADGGVGIGSGFRELEAAWMRGVAAMAAAGAHVVVDDVFLGGSQSQGRWAEALQGLDVLWVGVRCDATVAAARELARGDRAVGMAAAQADAVHRGVRYDVEVDTTHEEALACARAIAARLDQPVQAPPRR
ncbi:chloramphenicol phosphotransferase CPT [Cellulomonas edaphi]|uniref:Chloramphenicol phosphotransferase CPT n=1 Tax=Cellulomonas edaphi TaxID=3053468 RepID=A0ABT7S5H6_9CELL|nr:chloramphenicol phosphotransferase CPT [Cellulomons edaphi]MDM7830866.1 chloramphenicol phosphotransferase CPT [Cellulomons edaphi]